MNKLFSKLGESRKRGEWHDFRCPRCRDYKYRLAVNFKSKFFNCFNCGYNGSLSILAKKVGVFMQNLGNLSKIDKLAINDITKFISIPGAYNLEYRNENLIYKKVISYMRNRGIMEKRVGEIGMVVSMDKRYKGRVIIPIKENGETVCYIARSYSGREPKEIACPSKIASRGNFLYNLDFINMGDNVSVVEGIFDCEALLRAEIKSVACFGSHLTEVQIGKLLAKQPSTIQLLFDNDSAGRDGAIKTYSRILERGFHGNIFLKRLPEGKDPDELSSVDLRMLIGNQPC